jgi:hypothetical protein
MTTIYSVFDETGNLITWFDDRATAVDYLTRLGRANPEIAGDVFIMGDPDDPEWPQGLATASEVLSRG